MTLADISNGPTEIVYGFVLVLAVLSILLMSGRGSWLIAGYNTASKQEKEKYDEKKLCRVIGGGLAVFALLMLGMVSFEHLLPASFAYVFVGIIILVVLVMLVLVNTFCKK